MTKHLFLALVLTAGCAPEARERLERTSFSLSEVHVLTQSFVSSCVIEPAWADRFVSAEGRAPVLRVRGLTNRTFEDLDTSVIARVLAGEFQQSATVIVAPSSEAADFLLVGDLTPEIDRMPDTRLRSGHRRYVGHFKVVTVPDGQPVCSGTGGLVRLVEWR